MNSNTRWHRLIKRLNFSFIPFNFMSSVRIKTTNNKLYEGRNQQDFQEIFEQTSKDESDSISSIEFEPNNKRIKREVQKDLDPLFEKYFPSKLKD